MKYLTILIAIVGICFFACRSELTKEPVRNNADINITHIKTVPIKAITEESVISVLGIVMSESEAKPSFKTGGVINKTLLKEGDSVKKGQLLSTLHMDEINAQVRQAEESLMRTERDVSRVRNLYQDSVATLEQYQNITTAYEVTKRAVEIAKFNQNYSTVRSPISGKIIKQLMREGEVVGPGMPVYAIMGIGSQDWVIEVGLIDRDWAKVKIGDEVLIHMDAYPGSSYSGKVSSKSSVGGNTSGTFNVKIKFKSQPANLASGLTAKVNINNSPNKDTFVVIPIEALVKSNGTTGYVYTVLEGKAKKIKITISRLLGDKVAVSQGLEGVTEVVTTGAMYLEEGDSIKK